MNKFIYSISGACLFAGASMLPAPAMAQGYKLPVPHEGAPCPSGWTRGDFSSSTRGLDRNLCYSDNERSPAIVRRASTTDGCPARMNPADKNSLWCWDKSTFVYHEDSRGRGEKFDKPNTESRCPTGWITYSNHTQCYTMLENPPVARLSNGKPCNPGELADFGLWCTSNYEHLTYNQVDAASTNDFNVMDTYRLQNRMDPLPFDDKSDDAKAYFESKQPASAAVSTSASSTSGDQPAAQQTAKCPAGSGSASGAAIGGAIGGDAGAALGGMLGGLGKKKKKAAGC